MNASYFSGGRTTVNGVINDDRQGNSRVGATVSIPLNQQQSIKVAVAKGVTTRIGGHLSTVAVALAIYMAQMISAEVRISIG